MTSLSILFAGELVPAVLLNGIEGRVFVRALPQCHLHLALQTAEHKHQFVELVTYFKAAPKKPAKDHPLDAAVRCTGAPAFPEVEAPAGYVPVPLGWNQNLTDESIDKLYATAKKLNFGRAAAWARDQIAAKKLVAPLHQQVMEQAVPLVMQVLEPLVSKLTRLSASTPSSASSPVSPAPSSSPNL